MESENSIVNNPEDNENENLQLEEQKEEEFQSFIDSRLFQNNLNGNNTNELNGNDVFVPIEVNTIKLEAYLKKIKEKLKSHEDLLLQYQQDNLDIKKSDNHKVQGIIKKIDYLAIDMNLVKDYIMKTNEETITASTTGSFINDKTKKNTAINNTTSYNDRNHTVIVGNTTSQSNNSSKISILQGYIK